MAVFGRTPKGVGAATVIKGGGKPGGGDMALIPDEGAIGGGEKLIASPLL